jgi:hypothetical protein
MSADYLTLKKIQGCQGQRINGSSTWVDLIDTTQQDVIHDLANFYNDFDTSVSCFAPHLSTSIIVCFHS